MGTWEHVWERAWAHMLGNMGMCMGTWERANVLGNILVGTCVVGDSWIWDQGVLEFTLKMNKIFKQALKIMKKVTTTLI